MLLFYTNIWNPGRVCSGSEGRRLPPRSPPPQTHSQRRERRPVPRPTQRLWFGVCRIQRVPEHLTAPRKPHPSHTALIVHPICCDPSSGGSFVSPPGPQIECLRISAERNGTAEEKNSSYDWKNRGSPQNTVSLHFILGSMKKINFIMVCLPAPPFPVMPFCTNVGLHIFHTKPSFPTVYYP